MHTVTLSRGLSLPLPGAPQQQISGHTAPIRRVALLGPDYRGMRPKLLVAEGDRVTKGAPLFAHKKFPTVLFTAPVTGTVVAIERGARRALLNVVIECDADPNAEETRFEPIAPDALLDLDTEAVVSRLCASGLWTALRTRPFGKIPDPASRPAAIFVTAIDTRPLAADPVVVIGERPEAFRAGMAILAHLTDGKIYLCQAPGEHLPMPEGARYRSVAFAGPHPAGLPGTHIHFLEPVSLERTVWYLNYQDVIAIGTLFLEGRIDTERVVALGGEMVRQPRLVRVPLGASIEALLEGELCDGPCRPISGSPLDGRRAIGPLAYLGRYHLQVSVLPEPKRDDKPLLGWINPLLPRFSLFRVLFNRNEAPRFTTAQQGSFRAMIPTGIFEEICPLEILPTQLLRYLVVGDTDMAQKLGCLELEEEDVAIFSFACVGKTDYGAYLRAALEKIEREG
ncbi:MAG: Na(+)-translocating NADH-quinone reductase subunit A [Hydrogenophilus thermoluteolus]